MIYNTQKILKASDETIQDIVNDGLRRYGRRADLNYIDVSIVTDMSYLFYNVDFNGDVSKWNTSNVRYMYSMFELSTFNGKVSSWDISKVIDMSHMFAESNFNRSINRWDLRHIKKIDMLFNTHYDKEITRDEDLKEMFGNSYNDYIDRLNTKLLCKLIDDE